MFPFNKWLLKTLFFQNSALTPTLASASHRKSLLNYHKADPTWLPFSKRYTHWKSFRYCLPLKTCSFIQYTAVTTYHAERILHSSYTGFIVIHDDDSQVWKNPHTIHARGRKEKAGNAEFIKAQRQPCRKDYKREIISFSHQTTQWQAFLWTQASFRFHCDKKRLNSELKGPWSPLTFTWIFGHHFQALFWSTLFRGGSGEAL